VEQAALRGVAGRFALPRPMLGRAEPHFSFAGLKTAVRHQAQALVPLREQDVADLCAAFETAAADSVSDRVHRAMEIADAQLDTNSGKHLVVAGGVAANRRLREALTTVAASAGYELHVPPPALCTDNAAMVAWAGAERLARGWTDGLDIAARARWPLDPEATPALGFGRLGAKA
jgi:N6-L-threonylcarbamoyladenine synthase